jgi:hypothetical protein
MAKLGTGRRYSRDLRQRTAHSEGYQLYHNYVRPHESLNGKIPVDACGIIINGNDKWMTLIENAFKTTN